MSTPDPQPIIDAHHHFWDPTRNPHPWLTEEPMIPFRYGDYSAIRKPFLPDDYAHITRRFNVVATVTMEGEWDERDPVAESAWMSALHDRTGHPAAHVARAILHQPDAEDIIARHAAFPLVRGIRHKPAAAATPADVVRGAPGSLSDPAWQRGYAALAGNGLHFELQAPWWHIDELLDLIDRFPETPVVINHAFMPVDRSPEGFKGWRTALQRAAIAPQTLIKISGIGIRDRRWTLDDQRPIIETCIDAFGPERAMFASNFPVDGLVGSFDEIFTGFLEATADLPAASRNALFRDTAARVYRLQPGDDSDT